jgi:hypothetical protein
MEKKDVIFRHFFHGKNQEFRNSGIQEFRKIQENSRKFKKTQENSRKFRKIQENSGKFRKKSSEKFIKMKK